MYFTTFYNSKAYPMFDTSTTYYAFLCVFKVLSGMIMKHSFILFKL